MELRATFQIPTLIKALTDVVLPAVDPNNKLAQEQAQLVIGSLHLIAQRLPLQVRYDRFEIGSFIELAGQLASDADGVRELASTLAELVATIADSKALLARAGAEPGELETANLKLREVIGRLVEAASALPGEVPRKAIEATVLHHAEAQLLRERAWLAMQGWEGKDANLPAIETLIGGGAG